jgi:hypothetical protein
MTKNAAIRRVKDLVDEFDGRQGLYCIGPKTQEAIELMLFVFTNIDKPPATSLTNEQHQLK